MPISDRSWRSRMRIPSTGRIGLAVVTAAAAFLLLWRLDAPLLWQDEAETANIAVNLLETGVPTPWDGVHLVTQQAGRDAVRFGGHLLWAWHPWPQHALAAAGLASAGDLVGPTAAARLPFVLLALASIPLVWVWRRRQGPPLDATVTAAIYSLSIPFVLYSRQCRYYALLFLGGVLVFWLYDRLGDEPFTGRPTRRQLTTVGLAGAVALVFYANPLTGLGLAAGLGTHSLVCARKRLRAILGAGVLFSLLAAPWLALLLVSEVRAPDRDPVALALLFVSQLWRTQYTLLPAVLWPFLGLLWWRERRMPEGADGVRPDRAPPAGRRLADEVALLAVTGAVLTGVVTLQAPLGTARYLLPLWPLCAAVLAGLWRLLHHRSALLGSAFLVILVATDLLPSLPAVPVALSRSDTVVDTGYDREAPPLDKLARHGHVGTPLGRFLTEMAAPRCGPVAALVGFTRHLDHPPRSIAAAYAWESLHFYLGVQAVGPGLQGAARRRLDLPVVDPGRIDLVVPRRGWGGRPMRPHSPIDPERAEPFVTVDLGVPDDAYENLPDPTGARFRPSKLPPLTVRVRRELIPARWSPPSPDLPCTPPEPRIVEADAPRPAGRPGAEPAP